MRVLESITHSIYLSLHVDIYSRLERGGGELSLKKSGAIQAE